MPLSAKLNACDQHALKTNSLLVSTMDVNARRPTALTLLQRTRPIVTSMALNHAKSFSEQPCALLKPFLKLGSLGEADLALDGFCLGGLANNISPRMPALQSSSDGEGEGGSSDNKGDIFSLDDEIDNDQLYLRRATSVCTRRRICALRYTLAVAVAQPSPGSSPISVAQLSPGSAQPAAPLRRQTAPKAGPALLATAAAAPPVLAPAATISLRPPLSLASLPDDALLEAMAMLEGRDLAKLLLSSNSNSRRSRARPGLGNLPSAAARNACWHLAADRFPLARYGVRSAPVALAVWCRRLELLHCCALARRTCPALVDACDGMADGEARAVARAAFRAAAGGKAWRSHAQTKAAAEHREAAGASTGAHTSKIGAGFVGASSGAENGLDSGADSVRANSHASASAVDGASASAAAADWRPLLLLPPLHVLLSGAQVGNAGAQLLARSFAAGGNERGVGLLNLTNCGVGDSGALALARSLSSKYSSLATGRDLSALCLARNHVGRAGGLALANVVAQCPRLMVLYLAANPLGGTPDNGSAVGCVRDRRDDGSGSRGGAGYDGGAGSGGSADEDGGAGCESGSRDDSNDGGGDDGDDYGRAVGLALAAAVRDHPSLVTLSVRLSGLGLTASAAVREAWGCRDPMGLYL